MVLLLTQLVNIKIRLLVTIVIARHRHLLAANNKYTPFVAINTVSIDKSHSANLQCMYVLVELVRKSLLSSCYFTNAFTT